MGCRVGITTDPDRRKREHEGDYPSLRNWKILKEFNNKSAAQKYENEYAAHHGCDAHPGGAGEENDNWSVYRFDF